MNIKEISKMPKAAQQALLTFCSVEEFDFPKNIEDLQEIIRECGDSGRDRKDSNYIYCDYSFKTGGWLFEATGSSYLKDQCICDEEMDDSVDVTNIASNKKTAVKKKTVETSKNLKKWEIFIKKSSKKEILEKIKHFKFA